MSDMEGLFHGPDGMTDGLRHLLTSEDIGTAYCGKSVDTDGPVKVGPIIRWSFELCERCLREKARAEAA